MADSTDDANKSPVRGSPSKQPGRRLYETPEKLPTFELVGTPRKNSDSSDSSSFDNITSNVSNLQVGKDNEVEIGSCEDVVVESESSALDSNVGQMSRRKRRDLNRKESIYIQDGKKRTQKAKERMITLEQKAAELVSICGAKVYLKQHYKGPSSKVYEKEFGQNFSFTKDKESPQKLGTIEDIVSKAVSKTMKAHYPSQPHVDPMGRTPKRNEEVGTPSVAHRATPRRKGACDHCNQTTNNVQIYDHLGNVSKEIVTVVLACSFDNEGKMMCSRLVHADCLGFPGMNLELAEVMPNWYCKQHIAEGRRETFTESLAIEPVAAKGKKKLPKATRRVKKVIDTDDSESAGPSMSAGRKRSPIKKVTRGKKSATETEQSSDSEPAKGRGKRRQN